MPLSATDGMFSFNLSRDGSLHVANKGDAVPGGAVPANRRSAEEVKKQKNKHKVFPLSRQKPARLTSSICKY